MVGKSQDGPGWNHHRLEPEGWGFEVLGLSAVDPVAAVVCLDGLSWQSDDPSQVRMLRVFGRHHENDVSASGDGI